MVSQRKLVVLTTGRQDYGILRSTILLLLSDPRFVLEVWAGGMHLKHLYGRTVDHIRRDGVSVARELDFLGDPPDAATDSARAVAFVGGALADSRPDALVLLGDRTEILAAALAATLERIPIIHLHGGEESEGAIDNVCRHALTKLSHLHLVSHSVHARRVIQMGEDPDTVRVVGAPGLDNLYRTDLLSREDLERDLGCPLVDPVVLVTLHPTTLGEHAETEVAALASALERVRATYVITQPNSDRGGALIAQYWAEWAAGRDNVVIVNALGELRYFALLRIAKAVVGNSSSGMIEAPAAHVPVVNVGDRQKGRLRLGAIVDVEPRAEAIAAAIHDALSGVVPVASSGDEFPLGPAAPRIVEAIAAWTPPHPPRKRFHDT